MQFLAIIGALAAAVFLGSFMVAGITNSVQKLGTGFPTNYGYPYHSAQQGAIASAAAGVVQPQVAGASIKNETIAGGTIASTLATLPNTSRFATLFKEANGSAYLVEPTLYTLFVPTDDAFAKLTYDLKADINTFDAEEKARFVTYHLVPQKMVAVGGQRAGVVTAISRDALNFELTEEGRGTVGNAKVLAVYNVENGVVYVIDSVLLPPQKRPDPWIY